MTPLLRHVIKVITSSDLVEEEYAALQLCLTLGEPGTPRAYLLIGLSPGSRYHMCLRDILLVQPDSAADSSSGLHAWHPPPLMANPHEVSLEDPWDTLGSGSLSQGRLPPGPPARQTDTEPPVGNHYPNVSPMDDTLPRYKGWAAEATLYVSIDVL